GFTASPSSRGLGHYPFTVATGVRIPVGTPLFITRPASAGLVLSVFRADARRTDFFCIDSPSRRDVVYLRPTSWLTTGVGNAVRGIFATAAPGCSTCRHRRRPAPHVIGCERPRKAAASIRRLLRHDHAPAVASPDRLPRDAAGRLHTGNRGYECGRVAGSGQ